MQQTEKHRTKYSSAHTPPTSTKYQSEARDSAESQWKIFNRNNHTVPSSRTNRRQLSPTVEPAASYYSTSNSYRHRHHTCGSPLHAKYATAEVELPQQRWSQSQTRPIKSKLYTNNVAIVRKPRYKDDLDEDENLKYVDGELGNFSEENAEEDPATEEVEEDQEETAAESVDKEYEDQETEDEVDEESDASPELKVQKSQRHDKKEEMLRSQRPRSMEPHQQDPRRLRYQQYAQNVYEGHPPRGRYYNVQDQDFNDLFSEDDVQLHAPTAPYKSARKAGNYQQWMPATRNTSSNRYDCIISPPIHRRARTRQEMEPSLMPLEITKVKKCSKCGAIPGRRSAPSKKTNCRFQENISFPTKETIGDEADAVDQILCGRCNFRHNSEEVEFPRSTLYSLKPRRSKAPQEGHVVEGTANDYVSAAPRYSNQRDASTPIRERTKHPVLTARGPTRSLSRY